MAIKYLKCRADFNFEVDFEVNGAIGTIMTSGVSRILFRWGFKIFLEKWGHLHGAKRHAASGKATRLLGGFGGMLPEKFFKNGAIWCVLESILLKILSKNNLKNSHFLFKNNR